MKQRAAVLLLAAVGVLPIAVPQPGSAAKASCGGRFDGVAVPRGDGLPVFTAKCTFVYSNDVGRLAMAAVVVKPDGLRPLPVVRGFTYFVTDDDYVLEGLYCDSPPLPLATGCEGAYDSDILQLPHNPHNLFCEMTVVIQNRRWQQVRVSGVYRCNGAPFSA